MRLFIKRNIIEIIGLCLVVAVSIGLAYGAEWLLLHFTMIVPETAHLLFALLLPVILLMLQRCWHRLLQHPQIAGGVDIALPRKLDVKPETMQALETIYIKLRHYLNTEYAIPHFTMCVLDWQRKQFQTAFGQDVQKDYFVIPQNHALVHFAKHYRTSFTTERRSKTADEMPDLMQAELVVFMQKHHFVLMLPLYTDKDIYGFVFFSLADIKDSTLYAQADWSALNKLSAGYGGLLQHMLIYDAIVLNKQPKV